MNSFLGSKTLEQVLLVDAVYWISESLSAYYGRQSSNTYLTSMLLITLGADIPGWLERRREILWNTFEDVPFRLEDAAKILGDSNKDAREQIPVFLSELRRAGWLLVEADTLDARQKLYRLKSADQSLKEALTRGDINSLLKRAADLIRTRVDYKFILILLFLKRISDKWEVEYQAAYKEALADGLSEEDARAEAKRDEYHLFNLPEAYLWENLRKDVSGLTERFSRGLKVIADRNPELKDVVDSVDFIQFASSRENTEILRQLVELFSEKKLQLVSADVMGDAYEWILEYFAPTKAKEGEIYTPREVIKLLVEIMSPKPLESVYDPACGSGRMLILAHKYVEEKHGNEEAQKLFLYGQEVNQRTIALAKMNMYIHDIRDCHLEVGDTFLYPKFKEQDGLMTFNVVVSNPPWNQDGYDEEVLKKGEFWKWRFSGGFVPKQSADWAWIQHMVASAKEDGRVGIVIDNGCLFRGGKENAIRSTFLDRDWIECVVLLPEKLFYNTAAPGAIMIFRKNKPVQRKQRILFINSSGEFSRHPEVRKLNVLNGNHVRRIAEAYKTFRDEEGFSRVVPLDEIRQNECSLNVTLYVAPHQREEEINIAKEYSELRELEKERQETDAKLQQYVSEVTRTSENERDVP